uniref:Uncharacterized protein n=1 Tax=Anguilla anguilla TaxID=7936 RepID=A0A0E9X8K1_ANGAN
MGQHTAYCKGVGIAWLRALLWSLVSLYQLRKVPLGWIPFALPELKKIKKT